MLMSVQKINGRTSVLKERMKSNSRAEWLCLITKYDNECLEVMQDLEFLSQ